MADPVVVGLSALGTLHVINQGETPVTVSSRLNLMEGDVRLLVAKPDGTKQTVTGAGGQADTALRTVTLLPGQQIVSSMNLLYTSAGETFPEPGNYVLQAEYFPSPRLQPVTSEPVQVTARLPQTEDERGVAAILKDEGVKRALTLVESDAAPAALEQLAARFPEMLEGKLAQLILAGSRSVMDQASDENALSQASDPLALAQSINALSTPFSNVGKRLAKQFASILENQAGAADDSASVEKAVRILKGQPLEDPS
jgi:hypothetical protein